MPEHNEYPVNIPLHFHSDFPETCIPCNTEYLRNDDQMIDCYRRLSREQKRVVRELVRHYDSGWHNFLDAFHAGRIEMSKHSGKKLRVIEELTAACKRMDETRARLGKAEHEFLKTVATIHSNMEMFQKNMWLLENMMNTLFDSIGRNRLTMQLREQFRVCCWHATDIDYRYRDYREARVKAAV